MGGSFLWEEYTIIVPVEIGGRLGLNAPTG
jgi:hypothetical protein